MTRFDIRTLLTIAAAALATACGGSDTAGPTAAPAAPMAALNAPVADCEAEGCNRPRIIDGLAEQYRASAALQPELAAEPAPANEAAPAVPAAPQAPVLN